MISFLHGVGGVFFIRFKINITEYLEYEILLPPNCDLIVRKLKYINNEEL